jgi:hypothetical protein
MLGPLWYSAHDAGMMQDEDWKFAQTFFGITTHYRINEEDRSLTVRLQGELRDCSVFDQV